MAHWSAGDVFANAILLHYYRTSEGWSLHPKPQVVLCHGFSDSGMCWAPVAMELQGLYDLIMPDARGHGLSDQPETGYNMPMMSSDLAHMIRSLDLDRPVLIGHSMGGYVASLVAADYPEAVRGVILEDPGYSADPHVSDEQMATRLQAAEARLRDYQSLTHEELLARLHSNHPTWSDEEVRYCADARLQLTTKIAQLHTARSERWQDVVARIQCPVLMLTADVELGGIVTPAMAEEAVALCPTLRVEHVTGAGHAIRREQPEAFMDAVRRFLAECYSQ